MDGTLLRGNSSLSFCAFLHKKGFFSPIDLARCCLAYWQSRFLQLPLYQLHEKVFEHSLRGRLVADLLPCVTEFVHLKLNLMWNQPVVQRLLNMRTDGIEIGIFSNSPFFLVQAIAEKLDISLVHATDYALDGFGCLQGISSFVDGKEKAALLIQYANNRSSYAFSDSFHDLALLEAATTPIVVNPDRKLKGLARLRNWEIFKAN